MKIKLTSTDISLISLVGTLCVTTIIDLLVIKLTSVPKEEVPSSTSVVNQHDGHRIYTDLLKFAQEKTDITYPNASVDELISINFENKKFSYSCVASDEISKIAVYSISVTENNVESCLENISNILEDSKKSSYANVETTYYTYEDMTSEMLHSYKIACKVSGNSRYAFGRSMDPNKTPIFFATYKDETNNYHSINHATFSGDNFMGSSANKLSAVKKDYPYLYWTLFELCL